MKTAGTYVQISLNWYEYIVVPIMALLLMLRICSWNRRSPFEDPMKIIKIFRFRKLRFCKPNISTATCTSAYSSCMHMKGIWQILPHNKQELHESNTMIRLRWHVTFLLRCSTILAFNSIKVIDRLAVYMTYFCLKWPVEYAPEVWPLYGAITTSVKLQINKPAF
jgi:hypothetical protein